jgi:hypothetical protein
MDKTQAQHIATKSAKIVVKTVVHFDIKKAFVTPLLTSLKWVGGVILAGLEIYPIWLYVGLISALVLFVLGWIWYNFYR